MGTSDDSTPEKTSGNDPDRDASLDDALSDLENILDVQAGDDAGIEHSPAGAQYTIPLLDDVVIPGTEFPHEDRDETQPVPAIAIELDETSQAVINRLTNEIEVIVQAAMEDTLRKANKEITAKVKKHMNIVLEEILDELSDIRSRKGL